MIVLENRIDKMRSVREGAGGERMMNCNMHLLAFGFYEQDSCVVDNTKIFINTLDQL